MRELRYHYILEILKEKPVIAGTARQFLGIIYVLLFLMTGCVSDKEDVDTPDLDSIEIYPEVVFSVTDNEPLRFFIESRGVVEPTQKVQIIPRVGGFIDVHAIVDGKKVSKGELLLQLNKAEWEIRVKEAQNTYRKVISDYEVEAKLNNGGQVDDEMLRIRKGVPDAELAWDRAKLELSYTTIKAPFSGYISTKEIITNGAYIGAGKELGTLMNASRAKIRFDVLESELVHLAEGMEAELESPSGLKLIGKIVAISPEVDQESKTGQAIVEVDNASGQLKTGMTVEGRVFVRSLSGKVRMPRAALLERDGRTLVFRLNNGEVEWIYVTPEAMTTDWVIINHPDINPGDTLAVDKHFSISHQQRVVPLLTGENQIRTIETVTN